MTKDEVIGVLRRHEKALQDRGVRHAAIFGSVARGDARDDSDLDIMLDLDESQINAFEYAAIKAYIAALFPGRVDVVNRAGLKPYIRPSAIANAVYAF